MRLQRYSAALALALPLLAGCHEDDSLNAPDLSTSNGLMQRYVSMGNSITAGFQSAGINDSTQHLSYAVLFADAANAPFFVPSLQGRGCPPPFTNNVTQERVGGGTSSTCDLRQDEILPYVSNVAVPGATSFSPLDNLIPQANSNALTTFILGGRTQVQAMQDADPTFVSAWIGNNDVLGSLTNSANPGDPALVTPQAVFESNYGQMLDAIEATGASAALISVVDVSVIPYASRGATYWCIKNQPACGFPAPALPATFTVENNCAPAVTGIPGAIGDAVLVPWPVGIPKIAAAAQGAPTTLNCATDPVVDPTEFAGLQSAVAGYNSYIEAQAAARGMAYVDLNAPLLALVGTGAIPPFPDLSAALAGGSVNFGPYFSLDGVHPSGLAHQLVADSLTSAVNQTFGTTIPLP